jgi:adenine phosphoribosyltransferase
MTRLTQSLKNSPIIHKGDYHYVVHPLTDGIPFIDPELLTEITDKIASDMPECTRIVTMEAMGIPLATALSLKTKIPFTIIRKRQYGLPGEVEVHQKTGYSTSQLYINGISKNDSIVIVDDVLSTGGTLLSVVERLHNIGASVKKIFIVVNKTDKDTIQSRINIPIVTLADITVNDEVKIL